MNACHTHARVDTHSHTLLQTAITQLTPWFHVSAEWDLQLPSQVQG